MNCNTQNARIADVDENTLVVGIDVGSEYHYARAFDNRGVEYSKKAFKFGNTEDGLDRLINSMWNKKVRGQRRKLKALIKAIEHPTAPFEREGQCIELSVPSTPWIEMPKTYGKVKTEFCRKWIEETAILADSIPEDAGFCKVVGSIVYPQLWNSTILIFRDEEYYNSFWKRDDAYQIWTPIEGKSFIRERNIKTDLNEFGFDEVLKDEDFEFHCRIWFYTKDDLPLN